MGLHGQGNPIKFECKERFSCSGAANTPTPASVAPSIASLQQQLLMQSALSTPSLQSLGLSLPGSTALNLQGSTGSATADISPANLQNLATLANLSVSPGEYRDLTLSAVSN